MKPGIPDMENYGNIAPQWKDVSWDPGREYSVPWQWGTTGVAVNTSAYGGDINTSAIWLDPPEELKGKVNVVPEMQDVISLALMYVGGEPCTTDRDMLKKARDALLVAAKPHWMSMDYGMTEKLSNSDVMATVNWNGSTFRARINNPDVAYGYPKEGYIVWMDSAAILADAQNVENAKTFLNFIMDPENAALISSFARYANGIERVGSLHAGRHEDRAGNRRAGRAGVRRRLHRGLFGGIAGILHRDLDGTAEACHGPRRRLPRRVRWREFPDVRHKIL
jgi:spermidine/putrescine transport system substrate-binding protein